MTERHALSECQQLIGRRLDRRGRNPEPLGRAQQQRIADRLRRCDEQQTLRVIRERLELSSEALLDPSRKRMRLKHPEPAGQLRCREPSRQFEQCQRVPTCLRDDPVAHSLVQHEPHGRAQQRARVAVEQAVHLKMGHVRKLLARFARREHEPNRLSQEAPSHKRQREPQGLIQPLSVIDDTQKRPLLGHLREQAQHGQPDEEPIRGDAGAQPEHDLQCLTLRSRKPREPSEHRCAQLMQTGVGQLHLGLHPDRPRDLDVRRRLDQVLQQRRLPDPGLAPQDQ
jgi:hypothetical protein